MYQVLWMRLLGLVFGVTAHAASVTLAVFMGGLALGSFAGGRLAARAVRPLRWFAGAEAGVALAAIATPAGLALIERMYLALHPALTPLPGAVTALRTLCAALVLLPPTVLMGATLPYVIAATTRSTREHGARVAVLYASNTAGAIVGASVCGFVLIGSLGITASFRIAAALNVAVALGALVLASVHRAPTTPQSVPDERPSPTTSLNRRARAVLLAVFGLSGLTSLGLEVVWFRMLVLFLPATTYAFTVMVASVLAGIAVGSYVVAPFVRIAQSRRPLLALAVIQMLAGLLVPAGLIGLGASYQAIARTFGPLDAAGEGVAGMFLVSLAAILPAAVLFGVGFPLALDVWAMDADDDGPRRAGQFYAVNVAGAIVGSLVAGFVLLPWLGSRAALVTLAAVTVCGGLGLLAASRSDPRRLRIMLAALAIVVIIAAARAAPDPHAVVLAARYPGERALARYEGVQTTVSVHRGQHGGHVLYLDGLHQANDSGGMVATHRQLAHLPLAIHPDPRRALIIGLGGGATAGAAALHNGTSVDIVELSDSVVRGARWFLHVNYDVTRRPNVTLRIGDARHHLLVTRTRYDVITADIIQPIHAGAGNLYSAEYFALARDALDENGVMLQWVGRRAPEEYVLLVRTFLRVFPDATAWVDGTLLLGTRRPLTLDRAAFERKVAGRGLGAWYASLGTGTFDDLLALYTAGPRELARFVGEGPVLTDDRPMLEYFRSLERRGDQLDLSTMRGDVRRHVIGS